MIDLSRWPWLTEPLFAGVTPLNAALALLGALVAHTVMSTTLRVLRSRLARREHEQGSGALVVLTEVLAGTSGGLLLAVSLLIGLSLLDLPDKWSARVSQLWFVALALQVALWANRAVTVGLRRYAARHATGPHHISVAGTLISWGLRTLLWSVVLLAMLSNLGVNITAFVASLGVGGIAIALAAQNILGDLFASVSIAVDKPFEVGDFIAFGEVLGGVEYVGIKTTRLRSLSGEQIVIGNTDLLKQTIRNYKRMQERRIAFTFHLGFDSAHDQVAQVPVWVREAIEASDRLRFDRAHLQGFTELGLRYEVVYYVLAPEFNVYMDEQQRINLALLAALSAHGLAFAMPPRVLHVASVPATLPSASDPSSRRGDPPLGVREADGREGVASPTA